MVKQKNIENITYDDLLMVYNYETGEFTYEYPIWIEKKGRSNYYQKITFEDGSVLKTVGHHGIFNVDLNEFVNILDNNKFYVGASVYKYDRNKIKKVKVKNIENVYEKVNYYQVITSTYYNVVSDSIITTDGNVMLVNMYNFDNNMNWQINRNEVLKDNNNLFTYKEFGSSMPLSMYYGMRANEMKYLITANIISKQSLPYYIALIRNMNGELLIPNSNWKVTYSDGISNKYSEESIIKIRKPKNNKNFVGWLNTYDNKIYMPGDEYRVLLGTYFIAIYE